MEIHCTDEAVKELNRRVDWSQSHLKLVYDTEGCGCAVSGVAQLRVVDQKSDHESVTPKNPFPILYDPRHEIFFEEIMQIDYNPVKRSFILKSKHQIYNSEMQLKRKNVSIPSH